jgi:uncharacterized membrane protein YqjE
MGTVGVIVKAIVWGLSILSLVVLIVLAGAIGWLALDARSSPSVAAEAASTLLAAIAPNIETIEKLREYASRKEATEEWTEELRAENEISTQLDILENEIDPYCEKAQCIRWYDERYSLYSDLLDRRVRWATDLPAMLVRHANPEEIRSDNRLQLVRLACAVLAVVLLLYLLIAFVRFYRIGWRRLLALAAMVAPIVFVAFALGTLRVDALYGTWDFYGSAVTAAMVICILYPFAVIPPLWVLNKKTGRSMLEGICYWKTSREGTQ